jgi:hypothetical protein
MPLTLRETVAQRDLIERYRESEGRSDRLFTYYVRPKGHVDASILKV